MIFPKGSSITLGSTVVAALKEVNGPSVTRETYDSSTHGTADLYRTFIGGWIDPGELTFTVNWIPDNATHQETGTGFLSLLDATSATAFTLTIAGAGGSDTITGSCWLTGFNPTIPTDAGLTAEITLKLTGTLTFSFA